MARTLLFTLVCLFVSLSNTTAQCEHDCGPLGDCTLNEERSTCWDGHCDSEEEYYCKCKSGYSGADCSFRAPNTCRITGLNATLCFNGGVCEDYMLDDNTMGKRCNCQASYGQLDIHAGPQCEHDTTDVCEVARTSSHYAFCTNEGTCKAYVLPGEDHPGCNCEGTGYEGRHCQFPEGTAPMEEIIYVDNGGYTPSASSGDEKSPLKQSSGLTSMQVFLVVVMVGSALAIFAFIGAIFWKKKNKRLMKNPDESGIELDKVKDGEDTDPEVL